MKKLFIYSDKPTSPFWVEAFEFEKLLICETHTTFYVKGCAVGQIPNTMAFKIVEL